MVPRWTSCQQLPTHLDCTATESRFLPLPQLQQLPEDPFHPEFLQKLAQLSSSGMDFSAADIAAIISALQQPLAALAGESPAPVGVVNTPEGVPSANTTMSTASSSTNNPSLSTGSSTDAVVEAGDVYCVLGAILETIRRCLSGVSDEEEELLSALDQLLSSPEPLTIAIQLGLSARAQEAAKAGGASARRCIEVAHDLFQSVAWWLVVSRYQPAAGASIRELPAWDKLSSLLNSEENLPVLGLLCLPMQHSKRPGPSQANFMQLCCVLVLCVRDVC
jgi:hypothetical protein